MLTCGALIYGAASLLRPAISSLHHSRGRRAEVAGLIRRWGANATVAFALAPDKHYFLAAGERGAVAYVVAERIAVVLGDPIAAPDDIAPVLGEFVQWCHLNDLQVAFWQARAACLPLYHAVGLRAMKIGEEAVVDLAGFTLNGGAMQNVRTTMRHAEKAGVTVRFYECVVDDSALAAEVDGISRAWLASKGDGEMGFSMGRWSDTYLPGRIVAVAVDGDGHAQAFTTFVPVYGRNGWSLDLMRRSPQAPSGTMELLLVRTIERFREGGAAMLSLGLAPLANSAGEPMTGLDQLCASLSRRFGSSRQAASLVSFKRKFQPAWESCYIVYPGTLTLPRVGLAVLSVHLSRSWRSPAVLTSVFSRNRRRSSVPVPSAAGSSVV